jgi:hypothetical protein
MRRDCSDGADLRGTVVSSRYVFAESDAWPSGRGIPPADRARHRQEIATFAEIVANSEVPFHWTTYADLVRGWLRATVPELRDHATILSQWFNLPLDLP